jgi:hypothetical protein
MENSQEVSGIRKFNSVLYYYCPASTARRPITDAAQEKNKIINITK